jgi:Lon protease-like protein
MMKKFPKIIPIFPLSNFIIFPKTSVPLNIFEQRYIEMVDESMKTNKLIGMIQPKNSNNPNSLNLYNVGCLGKIISFKETEDKRYLIELKGIARFEIVKEIKSEKKYRECEVDFNNFNDIRRKKRRIKFSDLELIFKDLKSVFEKRGFIINWKGSRKTKLR